MYHFKDIIQNDPTVLVTMVGIPMLLCIIVSENVYIPNNLLLVFQWAT